MNYVPGYYGNGRFSYVSSKYTKTSYWHVERLLESRDRGVLINKVFRHLRQEKVARLLRCPVSVWPNGGGSWLAVKDCLTSHHPSSQCLASRHFSMYIILSVCWYHTVR